MRDVGRNGGSRPFTRAFYTSHLFCCSHHHPFLPPWGWGLFERSGLRACFADIVSDKESANFADTVVSGRLLPMKCWLLLGVACLIDCSVEGVRPDVSAIVERLAADEVLVELRVMVPSF